MDESVNPPARRIFFVGPKQDALRHARALYAVCKAWRQIPAFYENRTLGGVKRRLLCPNIRSAIVTFGPGSSETYVQTCQGSPPLKVLRLLEPSDPPPAFAFSYHNQIFPFPKTEKDYSIIASWMGLHRCFTEQDIFTEELPHTIPLHLLNPKEVTAQ